MTTDRTEGEPLARRLAEHLRKSGRVCTGDRLVVAVSGGLDSLVLLHLLRFGRAAPETELVAAHLDHRMRPGSSGDARWLRGLARAWGVTLEVGSPTDRPSGQEEARAARYEFLEGVRARHGARWILTAHHRDDQAETVLHRVLRGTGPGGLKGIPAASPLPTGSGSDRRDVVLRPLLPFWRAELEAHARRAGLRPREDPTNVTDRYARNVIRRELLPRAEEAVAPGAREALVRLAEVAAEEEAAWDAALGRLEEGIVVERGTGGILVHRHRFLAEPPALQRRLLRRWLAALGVRPTRAGTVEAQEFSGHAVSGRRINLPGGLELRRDYDRLWLGPARRRDGRAGAGEAELPIPGEGPGGGTVRVGGRAYRVEWGPADEDAVAARAGTGRPWTLRLAPSSTRFPLRVRAWRAGDRVRLPGGSKKLAKALGERRVPRDERGRLPVLVDAGEGVVWVPGVLHAAHPGVGTEGTGEAGVRITVVPENQELQ